ncbi:Pectinesterase inhibitor 10 [Linum grandiflorum]
MASHSSSFSAAAAFLTILLISSTTTTTATAATNTEFIRTSCTATTYPKLCYASLSIHAAKIQSSAKLLAAAALDVTLTSAKSSSAAMSKLSRAHGLLPRESAAMKDCIELRRSIDEFESTETKPADLEMMISDVQTWVSAALTDEGTCMDGFSTAGKSAAAMKEVVRGKVEKIVHLTSNALALVNSYANSLRN